MSDGAPTPPGPQGEQSNPHRAIARWTLAVAFFTLCLVIVSGIADWFIYQQYQVANQAQADTREQLRAVISPRGGNEITFIGPAPDYKLNGMAFVAHFYNAGGTRTAALKGWISAHYFAGTTPPNNLDLSKPYDAVDVRNVTVAANSPYDLGPVGIPAKDAESFFQREGIGLVWGHIDYADIFNPEVSHPLSFCILVTLPPDAPGTTPSSGGSTPSAPAAPQRPLARLTPYRADCNTQ